MDQSSFQGGLRTLLRSRSNFILAEFRGGPGLYERADEVLVWRGGGFESARQLINECTAHRKGGLVYEAWAWETTRRIQACIRELDATAGRALAIAAKCRGLDEVDTVEMIDSLHEAQQALYGNSWEHV